MKDIFRVAADRISHWVGTPLAFALAVIGIAIWALCGPLWGFSDTWQLVINTTTTIITFLMVFLIQNTQNRDARALHLKLDELIRATEGARNEMIDLEEMSEEQLENIHREFCDHHQRTSDMIEHIEGLRRKRRRKK
ncbi:MAG: low affinity iron permease family protein [Bdellovibrio sp.]|nr:low affinity iron permease family protein [Bdellovibrio sp.]